MSGLITILMQLLPLILRLFGLGAIAAASVSYSRITAADPDLALTAAPMLQYAGGWGLAATGSFSIAGLLQNYLRNRVKGLGDLVAIIREICQFLSENPEAFDFIKKLLELFRIQGVDVSQVEASIEKFRPAGGGK
jgi:hypothetical protein